MPIPTTDSRPDPETLLAEASREGRGKLKIFLGAAPGVGKTFDIFAGETVRVLAVYDPEARERELVMTKKAEEFDNA